MADKEIIAHGAHNVIMENRSTLTLSGVMDVDSFNEQSVVLITEMGTLTIRGDKLHISHLDQDTGELNMSGDIDELVYSQPKQERRGFFARLMR